MISSGLRWCSQPSKMSSYSCYSGRFSLFSSLCSRHDQAFCRIPVYNISKKVTQWISPEEEDGFRKLLPVSVLCCVRQTLWKVTHHYFLPPVLSDSSIFLSKTASNLGSHCLMRSVQLHQLHAGSVNYKGRNQFWWRGRSTYKQERTYTFPTLLCQD